MKKGIISSSRTMYLREIAETCRKYNSKTIQTVELLKDYEALEVSLSLLPKNEEVKLKFEEIQKNRT